MNSAIDAKAGAIATLLSTLKLPLHTLAKGKGAKGKADPEDKGVSLMQSLLLLGADTEVSHGVCWNGFQTRRSLPALRCSRRCRAARSHTAGAW
jgi:hypothetical protein